MALGAGRRKRGGAADRQELVARLVGSWLAHDYDTFDRAVDDALRAGRPGAFAVAAGQVADAADRGLSGGDAEDEDALADAVDELGDRPDEAEAFLAAVVDRAGTVALDDGRVAKLVAVPALIDRDAPPDDAAVGEALTLSVADAPGVSVALLGGWRAAPRAAALTPASVRALLLDLLGGGDGAAWLPAYAKDLSEADCLGCLLAVVAAPAARFELPVDEESGEVHEACPMSTISWTLGWDNEAEAGFRETAGAVPGLAVCSPPTMFCDLRYEMFDLADDWEAMVEENVEARADLRRELERAAEAAAGRPLLVRASRRDGCVLAELVDGDGRVLSDWEVEAPTGVVENALMDLVDGLPIGLDLGHGRSGPLH